MWLKLLIGSTPDGTSVFAYPRDEGDSYVRVGEDISLNGREAVTPAAVNEILFGAAGGQVSTESVQALFVGDATDRVEVEAWLTALFPQASTVQLEEVLEVFNTPVDPAEPMWTRPLNESGTSERLSTLTLAVPYVWSEGGANPTVRWMGLGMAIGERCAVLCQMAVVEAEEVGPQTAHDICQKLTAEASEWRAGVQRRESEELDPRVPPVEAFGYFMYAVAKVFQDEVDDLAAFHERWESAFFRAEPAVGGGADREALLTLGEIGVAVRQAVTGLLRIRNSAWGWLNDGNTLPSGVPQGEQDALSVLRGLPDRLRTVRSDVRESLDLVASRDLATQFDAQQRAQDAAARFQLIVTLVTSLVLVPGFIASFWGANVWLPWKDEWGGTVLLIGLMVVAGWGTLALLLRVEREKMTWQEVLDHLKYDLLALKRPG